MRRLAPSIVALAGLATLAGCFNPFSPRVLSQRVVTLAPSPNTPENAVKLFEWCWVNRGVDEYRELFTDDYVFISAGTDSAGNPSREIQARRDDEVQIAENMFIGSADRPPAESITLFFDQNLVTFPDTRPGKDSKWHKQVRTHVDLKVKIDSGNTAEVTGSALFFITRGDSAAIPKELQARGFRPDSLRWWIDRWEDETLEGSGLQALRLAPAGGGHATPRATAAVTQMTMGELKRYYDSPLPALTARTPR